MKIKYLDHTERVGNFRNENVSFPPTFAFSTEKQAEKFGRSAGMSYLCTKELQPNRHELSYNFDNDAELNITIPDGTPEEGDAGGAV